MNTNPRQTIFSPCRLFRYTLWREWFNDPTFFPDPAHLDRAGQYVQFIGLNPSTADEVNNDPTVSRCINYAKRWGYGGLCMTNAFAYRSTDPYHMKAAAACGREVIGADNDRHIQEIAQAAGIVVAAWGVHAGMNQRDQAVLKLLPREKVHCLKTTAEGYPNHPLYLRKDLTPIPYPII